MRLVLSAALALVATTAVAQTQPVPQPGDTVFTGWVRFSEGEFQLYADEDQVRRPFARPCVSGVLPRDLQRQAANDLGGQKVRVTGATVEWSNDLPGNRIAYEGSTIRNGCGGTIVIQATEMSPAR